jgi:hypothetical protein
MAGPVVVDDLLVTRRQSLPRDWKTKQGKATAAFNGDRYRIDVDLPTSDRHILWAMLPAPTSDGYLASVRVLGSGGTDGACGLALRTAKATWGVTVHRDTKIGQVFRFSGSGSRSIIYFTGTPLQEEQLVSVGVSSGLVDILVDGIKIATFTDPDLTKITELGVTAEGGKATCSFDRLTVQGARR